MSDPGTLSEKPPVAVIGATGYIGGRLVPRLLANGHRVRAVARDPAKLRDRPWSSHPQAAVMRGDVFDLPALTEAVRGCRAVYYLVHSMNPGTADFARADREAAANMAAAAEAGGVGRIIYLGGLGEAGAKLSRHLRSRAETAAVLRSGAVPVTVLRAAMIIGSGSASFEILRYLVDRLPVMITPRWISTPCQPIGVRNVLHYLIGCLDVPETAGGTFDIGQDEVVSYRRLMEIYAEEAGLARRLILPVPVLTPWLSSWWIHLVTPVPAALARPLAEGLSTPVVCRDHRLREFVPQPLLSCREAIRLAIQKVREGQVESCWSDAGPIPPAEWSLPEDPAWAGGTVLADGWRVALPVAPETVWPALARIGGRTGWYFADWLWRLRGGIDRLAGGVGLGRGRRDAAELRAGDALDFWRVAAMEPPRRLLLAAEMKLPGQAVLEFTLTPRADGGTELRQVARFLPRGLSGMLYWFAVYPFHFLVFKGLLRGIAAACNATPLDGPERLPAAVAGARR